jgi:hypothetical protein
MGYRLLTIGLLKAESPSWCSKKGFRKFLAANRFFSATKRFAHRAMVVMVIQDRVGWGFHGYLSIRNDENRVK